MCDVQKDESPVHTHGHYFSHLLSSSSASSCLKARVVADQQSSSASRSCPKKTILLPSSASSLSLHSEVTPGRLFLVCFVLSVPTIHPQRPCLESHYPRTPMSSTKASLPVHLWPLQRVRYIKTKHYISPSGLPREVACCLLQSESVERVIIWRVACFNAGRGLCCGDVAACK